MATGSDVEAHGNESNISIDVWKWIAGSLVAVMLALLIPSVGWFIDTRNTVRQDDFNVVYERQQLVLQRLAVLDVQLTANAALIRELQIELRQHISTERKK